MLNKSPSVLAKLPVDVPVDAGALDVFDEVLDALDDDFVVAVELLAPADVRTCTLEVCSDEGSKETTDDALVVFNVVAVDVERVVLAEALPGTHCS